MEAKTKFIRAKVEGLIIDQFGKGTLINLGNGSTVMVATALIRTKDSKSNPKPATLECPETFKFKVRHSTYDQSEKRYVVDKEYEIDGKGLEALIEDVACRTKSDSLDVKADDLPF